MANIRFPQPILFRAQPMRADQASARIEQARELVAGGQELVLAWGGLPPDLPMPDGVSLVQLPPAWARDDAPDIMLDDAGQRADWSWKKRRAAALLALFAGMRPALMVLDGAPSLFRFELRPLLEMARRRPEPPRLALWPAGAEVGPELAPLLADQLPLVGLAAAIAAL